MDAPFFSCALSALPDPRAAERAAFDELSAGLGGRQADLIVAFATHHFGEALEELGPRLAREFGAGAVIGCTAEGVVGASREIEGRPGISLWAARLPGTRIGFFECPAISEPTAEVPLTGFPEIADPGRASLILVADPFSFPSDAFLSTFDERFPGVPVMGGMASGAAGPGQCLLFTADGIRDGGAVGVVLEGGVRVHPIVSQGCRPVGKQWVITACERNWIQKLGGRPALEVLMETWTGLSPEDRERLGAAPFLGLAADAAKSRFDRGDFLVRGIMSLHQADRAFAVGDFVRRGQTVQLLVRDAESATEDLRLMLEERSGGAIPEGADPHGLAALIFTCNGRGSRMFSMPDHDVRRVRTALGDEVPIAGFFAAGEIGPVGGRNFLHSFTASVAVFREEEGG